MDGAVGVDEAMPGEGGGGFGEGGDTAGRFTAVSAGFEGGEDIGVKRGAGGDIDENCYEGEDGGGAAAGIFVAGADFGADEVEKFGDDEGGHEDGDDPRVHIGEPVRGDTVRAEGPEEGDGLPLAGVHGQVQNLGEESDQECGAEGEAFLNWFGRKSEVEQADSGGEEQGSEKGMQIGAVPGEIGGWAEVGAEEIEIGDGASENGDEPGDARGAGDDGAGQREGR